MTMSVLKMLKLNMPIMASLIFAVFSSVNAENIIPDLYLQSEYRKDSIDYSEIENVFYREKVEILFSRKSSLNFTYIYIDEFEEN